MQGRSLCEKVTRVKDMAREIVAGSRADGLRTEIEAL